MPKLKVEYSNNYVVLKDDKFRKIIYSYLKH